MGFLFVTVSPGVKRHTTNGLTTLNDPSNVLSVKENTYGPPAQRRGTNMSKTVEFTTVKPSEVRAFAEAAGLVKPGQRGLLPEAAIKAFNKGKKKDKQYDPHKHFAPTVVCVGKVKGRPPVRKTVAVPVLRAAAAAAGVKIGERGRIPAEVKTAYALGTLGQ
jgi:hypothetical protein